MEGHVRVHGHPRHRSPHFEHCLQEVRHRPEQVRRGAAYGRAEQVCYGRGIPYIIYRKCDIDRSEHTGGHTSTGAGCESGGYHYTHPQRIRSVHARLPRVHHALRCAGCCGHCGEGGLKAVLWMLSPFMFGVVWSSIYFDAFSSMGASRLLPARVHP